MEKELSYQLEKNFQELIHLLSGLSEKQMNTVPVKDSWTAAQLGEHLFKSYQVTALFNGSLKKTERKTDEHVDPIKEVFLNFDKKMKSPQALLPSETMIDKTTLINGLTSVTKQLVEFSNTKDLAPICMDEEMPGFGHLTILEWLHFINFHTQRHLVQLKKIIPNVIQNQTEHV